MTRKEKIVYVILFLVVVALCGTPVLNGYLQKKQLVETYAQAEALVQSGEYAEALELLDGLKDSYRNVKSLKYYSQARLDYELGNLSKAESDLFWCDEYMASGEVMPEGYEKFRTKVSAEYTAYAQEELRKSREAYQEKVRTGVPFVGMSEADIAKTSLGAPSSRVEHNWEWVGNERITTNLYSFYEDGRKIFIARCFLGKVDDVWDNRNSVPVPTARSYRKSSKSKEEEDDPFHAKDYLFPEDFYEDYFDEFYDFYDAEDYYYEHGGT